MDCDGVDNVSDIGDAIEISDFGWASRFGLNLALAISMPLGMQSPTHQEVSQLSRSGITSDKVIHDGVTRVPTLVLKHPVCQKCRFSAPAFALDDQWNGRFVDVASYGSLCKMC